MQHIRHSMMHFYKQENKILRSGACISRKIFRDKILRRTLIIVCLTGIKKLLVPKATIFDAIMKFNICGSVHHALYW